MHFPHSPRALFSLPEDLVASVALHSPGFGLLHLDDHGAVGTGTQLQLVMALQVHKGLVSMWGKKGGNAVPEGASLGQTHALLPQKGAQLPRRETTPAHS